MHLISLMQWAGTPNWKQDLSTLCKSLLWGKMQSYVLQGEGRHRGPCDCRGGESSQGLKHSWDTVSWDTVRSCMTVAQRTNFSQHSMLNTTLLINFFFKKKQSRNEREHHWQSNHKFYIDAFGGYLFSHLSPCLGFSLKTWCQWHPLGRAGLG